MLQHEFDEIFDEIIQPLWPKINDTGIMRAHLYATLDANFHDIADVRKGIREYAQKEGRRYFDERKCAEYIVRVRNEAKGLARLTGWIATQPDDVQNVIVNIRRYAVAARAKADEHGFARKPLHPDDIARMSDEELYHNWRRQNDPVFTFLQTAEGLEFAANVATWEKSRGLKPTMHDSRHNYMMFSEFCHDVLGWPKRQVEEIRTGKAKRQFITKETPVGQLQLVK